MWRIQSGRRAFFVGSAALLTAGWLPTPVPILVVNETSLPVHVRLAADQEWREVKPRGREDLRAFNHDGLCSPPDRWLPDRFEGLQLQRFDGTLVEVSRARFEEDATWDHGRWTYRFKGPNPAGDQ